jgi:hypothetical protein
MSFHQTEARIATYDHLDLQIQTAEVKLETLKPGLTPQGQTLREKPSQSWWPRGK